MCETKKREEQKVVPLQNKDFLQGLYLSQLILKLVRTKSLLKSFLL